LAIQGDRCIPAPIPFGYQGLDVPLATRPSGILEIGVSVVIIRDMGMVLLVQGDGCI
ncbi:unnamed protein product, partial [marine sediment metagenome]